MVTLERFKLYARIDHADEDELITATIAAADTAVRDMTGKAPPGGADELFDVAVLQLAAHWYENRTPTADASARVGTSETPFALQMLLNHIALSGRYPAKEDDDGTDERPNAPSDGV